MMRVGKTIRGAFIYVVDHKIPHPDGVFAMVTWRKTASEAKMYPAPDRVTVLETIQGRIGTGKPEEFHRVLTYGEERFIRAADCILFPD